MDSVQCNGTERYLSDCAFGSNNKWGAVSSSCYDHTQDAGVVCISSRFIAPVRLANGTSANEGRVEINIHGHWGTICDVNWHFGDALAICKQLGYDGMVYII